MKTIQTILFAFLAPILLQAQGTFWNLDFEQATIVPLGGGNPNLFSALNAVPNWTVYSGNSPVNFVLYDNFSLSGGAVSIQDTFTPFVFLTPLEGEYSVLIQHTMGITPPSSAAIGQTGQLPVDAAALFFYAANFQDLQVTFAGNILSFVQVAVGPNYSILGADISGYAGQSGELRFTATAPALLTLDNIQFSSVGIPEPSVFSLFGLGLFGLAWHRHIKRGRK